MWATLTGRPSFLPSLLGQPLASAFGSRAGTLGQCHPASVQLHMLNAFPVQRQCGYSINQTAPTSVGPQWATI